MAEEQVSRAEQLGRIVSVLATGDWNADGVVDFPPAPDLHVAVITADLGSGGSDVPSCARLTGDDALLLTRADASTPGCMAAYPPYLALVRGDVDAIRFASDAACVGDVGPGGRGVRPAPPGGPPAR